MVEKPNLVKKRSASFGIRPPFQLLTDAARAGTALATGGAGITFEQTRMEMRMDERADLYGRRDNGNGFERLASSVLDYVRSRTTEHWLMFVIGLMIGLFLG
jgi:hypothetical protein